MTLYNRTQHIVVLGAGYAGLPCALRLARKLRKTSSLLSKVTLINNEPRQELTCELFRTLRSGKGEFFNFQSAAKRLGLRFIEGHVSKIDPVEKSLSVRGESSQEIKYDHLVVAAGFKARIPQIAGIDEFIDGRESVGKRVFLFRNNIQVQQLRFALKRMGWNSENRFDRDRFVIILGAGTTGLEVAGELAYLRGNNSRARIVMVDEKTEMLQGFSPIAKKLLKRDLARMRIETVLGSSAVSLTPTELNIQNGQVIPWDLLILCSGGRPSGRLFENFKEALTPMGLKVKQSLQIEGFPDHYAIGDIAQIPRPLHAMGNQSFQPKTAQYSVQEGHFVADIIFNKLHQGNPVGLERFDSSDFGYMVSLGPFHGFGRLGPEIQSTAGRFLSPFVAGPPVDSLKRLAKLRYLSALKFDSWKVKFNPFV